jgi:RNA polymerase sigma factor (sigma-70 family)
VSRLKKYNNYTDSQLVDIIVAGGDFTLFELLYDRYIKKVYNKTIAIIGYTQDVDDVTQEIFIKIFLNLKYFKGESAFSTWVFSIAFHYIIDYIRSKEKQTEKTVDIEYIKTFAVENDDRIFAIEPNTLWELLNQLDSDSRMILLLKYQDEMPIKEIMKIFNIKEGAVKMRLSRAKEKVYQLYEHKLANITL